MKALSLKQRILMAFIASSVLVAVLFGVSAVIFAYHTEDEMFSRLLRDEAVLFEGQLAAGTAIQPRLEFVRYVADSADLPAPIQMALASNPQRREFALEQGQHYHLIALSRGYLLADVTEQLVVRHMRSELSAFLLSLLAVVVLAAVGFAYLLASRVLKPLQQLTELVDDTGRTPDRLLSEPFADNFSADEIGRLARALQDAWQRVAEFIDREQQFTQDVSHELRTPVAVIQGALTLLEQSSLNAQQQQLLARLQSAQLQISQTIDTLMLLAREQLPAPTEAVKLLPLVEQSVLQQQAKLADKDVSLELAIAPDAQLHIDPTTLLILLNNLIGNAFTYTETGVIRITHKGQALSVHDSGSGIDPQLQPQVFDRGIKGRNSTGMGVGLALVKRLCDRWQIGYQLHSDASGTCVRLTFAAEER